MLYISVSKENPSRRYKEYTLHLSRNYSFQLLEPFSFTRPCIFHRINGILAKLISISDIKVPALCLPDLSGIYATLSDL